MSGIHLNWIMNKLGTGSEVGLKIEEGRSRMAMVTSGMNF